MPPGLRAAAWAVAMSLAVLLPAEVPGQEPPAPAQRTPLRVFLDCEHCDFDHLRREVAFVDYVRQPQDAQVHVLVTSQEAGGGGEAYILYLIGQGEFASRQDTVRFVTDRDATSEEQRAALTQHFGLALVSYALRTTVAADLSVRYQPRADQPPPAPARDPWNQWVFLLGVGTSIDGESRQNAASFDGRWSASRTTEQFKVAVSGSGRYETEHFELNDGRKLTSITRNSELEGLAVWSLGPHWSAGLYGAVSSSTRLNQDLVVLAAPALEYNLFPYAESTRRQILFTYAVGGSHYRYHELTLFNKLRETRGIEQLQVSAGFQQPWGEIDGSLELTNYLDDFSTHRINFHTGIEVRLFRGFGLDIRGNVARIKDQIYIAREDLTDEEILLELRELGTDFEYELEVGFSYSFGSRLNNIVNPRMRL